MALHICHLWYNVKKKGRGGTLCPTSAKKTVYADSALILQKRTILQFLDLDSTGLVFRSLGVRIKDRIGQPVGARLTEMECHPD